MADAPRPRRKSLKSTESIPFSPALLATEEPAPAAHPSAKRMLLIEDNDELRRLTADRFRALGWDVFAARDVRTAIELALTVQPNAIVTELILPDVRGYHFARTLRSVVDHDVQVIAVTRLSKQLFEHAQLAGFDRVLAKPIDVDHLQLVLTGD